MSRKLIINSLSGTILYLLNIVVAFVMSPIIIRTLGNNDYGLWELVMSVIGYMGILDLGIGQALVRFISVADGKKMTELQETISTAFAFFSIIGGFAFAVFVFLAFYPGILISNQINNASRFFYRYLYAVRN